MADLVGKILDRRYRIVARLGRGGMAEVYKADQPSLGRYVAIKVLHSHLVDDEDFIGRFSREAKAIGRLRHPNIVQALEFNGEGDTFFLAMEFIDGPSLKDELKARQANNLPFSLKEIGLIFTALCSAIDYAHARDMVHRDLKPANVMINEEGQIVLTDFGIARVMGATQYTQTGALSGTPAYMSPEQGQGERGDKRSDIYALGIMLYEMVTGAVPYDADTPFAVIMKHISEPLPRPTQVDPNIPQAVEDVVIKAMAKNPDDRFQSAGEMAKALRAAVDLVPGQTLQNAPLIPVASGPQVQEIDHPTGPITEAEIAATMAPGTRDGGATVIAQDHGATTVAQPARGGLPSWVFAAGGGLIVVVILAAVALAFTVGQQGGQDSESTQVARTNATRTVEANQTAEAASLIASTQTAVAATDELLAPTKTAEAAIAQETSAAATEAALATRDAQIVAGALSAQAATSQAQETARAAAAEAATATAVANATPTPEPTETPTPEPPTSTLPPPPPTNPPAPAAEPTDVPQPALPPISGKLAFPVDDGAGKYDVHIVSMPDGDLLGKVTGARQPDFRPDGNRLVVNGEGGGFGEDVWEVDVNGNVLRPVSSSPSDSHPTYNPDGGRIAYGNPQLAIGSDGNYHSYVFVQCGIIPPSQENDKCQNIAEFGILVPAGQVGEIQGSNPVWAANDHIFYKGCNSWAGGGSCGIFTVGSWATKQFSNGETPRKLADGTSLTPTDSVGNLLAYHSSQPGNWEAFVMDLSGAGVVNISESPNSSDGLPAISPNGQWVAFASDREGAWAVFVAPSSGGSITKLFDFPKGNPWGTDDRAWQNERMSWGP